MNYKVKKTSIAGDDCEIKVPNNIEFVDRFYNNHDAAKVIFLNIKDTLRGMTSIFEIEKLLDIQLEYIYNMQSNNKEFTIMDLENVNYLEKQVELNNLYFSKFDILEIFDKEIYYKKLINIVD